MIKNKIMDILAFYFDPDEEYQAEVAAAILDMVREEVEEGIKIAIEVRFNGVPQ